MVTQLVKYIRANAGSWSAEFRGREQLTPLYRFNKENNGIVENEQIGTVVFWFMGKKCRPSLVTKAMDRSLSVKYIKSCAKRQEQINRNIRKPVFPVIYDVTNISGQPVIFQEAVDSPNYEMELSNAIHGPFRNLLILKQTIERHFKEMGFLFSQLKTIDVSEESFQWGDWAYRVGISFRDNYGLGLKFLSNDCLNRMRREINSVPLQRNYVLVDHYSANYFVGPRVVDQIDLSLTERMNNEFGLVDVFRFIIAYFRSSSLYAVYDRNWLDALVFSIFDKKGLSIAGSPLRKLLDDVGVNVSEPKRVVALLMASFFLRAIDELTFHRNNVFVIPRLRIELEQLTKRLVEIQELVENGDDYNFPSVFSCEKNFTSPSESMSRGSFAHPPFLAEEGYKGFNIVLYMGKYYALSLKLGSVDLIRTEESQFKKYQEEGMCFIAESFDKVKRLVDKSCRGKGKDMVTAETGIDEHNKVINSLRSEILARDENIAKLNEDIDKCNTTINGLKSYISTRDENIAKLNKRIDGLQSNISDYDKTIETLNKEISTRDKNIDNLSSNIKVLNKRMDTLQSDISRRDKSIETLNKEISDRDGNINKLNTDIKKLDETIDSLRSDISARSEDIAKLKADVEKRNNSIDSLQTAVSGRGERIEALNDEVSKRDENIARLNTELTKKCNCIKDLEMELAGIKSRWYFRLFNAQKQPVQNKK